MKSVTKRYTIKIPANISMYFCTKNQIIVFSNCGTQKKLILKTKLIVDKAAKLIKVTREPLVNISNNERKKLKSIQVTQVMLLKQMLLEVALSFSKKLNFIGVGFRVSTVKKSNFEFLQLKLGYSHFIYFKIPKNLKIFCLKANKLFIIGNSYLFVTQIAALIKSYKMPEPYKGKGILYSTEKVKLKEGKKI